MIYNHFYLHLPIPISVTEDITAIKFRNIFQ